jgi:hypothetical protein
MGTVARKPVADFQIDRDGLSAIDQLMPVRPAGRKTGTYSGG